MKKRDKYLLMRLFGFLLIAIIFAAILFLNMIQFNNSYMNEEQEELHVFTRQIEWAIQPYLKNQDYATLKKYTDNFKNEDITIRIFDSSKNLIATSKSESTGKLLSGNSKILRKKHSKWKIYRYSIKDKMLGHVKKLNIDDKEYYLEVTISEADVISSIIHEQRIMMIFFGICILLFFIGLIDTLYRVRSCFNRFEDSIIKIAAGELDTPVDISNLEILEEISVSVKKMTQRLKNQILRLTQLEQYKTDFLQNITHEIKTPITAINSAIELIENNNSISDTDKECFDIIQFQIKSIDKLVNDILCLSETEVAKTDEKKHFRKVPLNSIIKDEIDKFSHFEQKINFIQNDDIDMEGNPELLATAISNLLTNAIKYSGSDEIDVSITRNSDSIKLQVKDYGAGIAEEHLAHIFEKFYRADKARSRQNGGSGLGLAIVKNIVELHNGTITVESKTGVGTTFTIVFQPQNI